MMNFANYEENLLRIIVASAGIILGSILSYNVFLYPSIELHWKVAITTFILFLPFSFFLQVSLNTKSVKDYRMSRIQSNLRAIYVTISARVTQPNVKDPGKNVLHDEDFRSMFKERSDHLRDGELLNAYQDAYELCLKKEREAEYSDQLKASTRRGILEMEFGELLKKVIDQRLEEEGLSFRSYLVPLLFFLFTYFAGFMITLPLINSVFTSQPQTISIPLFDENTSIPFLVIQWGFLGGFVYTSISLLNRFLRRDLAPRVYLLASLRLLLSAVVAVVIYFLYILMPNASVGVMSSESLSFILLLCFLAGVAPIQLLITFADNQLSRIDTRWKRREVAANMPLTRLDGINSVIADRLSEEGYDYLEQIALCDPSEIASKTNFPAQIINDWKDQAIFYVLTADVVASQNEGKKVYLNSVLKAKLGVRTISALLDLLVDITKKTNDEKMAFFKGLGLLDSEENSFDSLNYLFTNIQNQGILMRDNIVSSSSYKKLSTKNLV